MHSNTDPQVYMVTVKLPKNAAHNPRSKVTAACPADPYTTCTDATGEHHTLLVRSRDGFDAVTTWACEKYGHVTRIEKAPWSIIDIDE